MTTPILNSANAGLQKASEQLNKAARSIIESASGQNVSYKDIQDDALTTGEPTAAPAIEGSSQSQASAPATGAYIPSLAEEIVQLKLAAHAYKANARLLRAADEVSRAVLDSLNEKKDG
jgi:hypothetical protein